MREKSLIFRGFRACVSSGFRQATLEPRGGVWGPEQAPKVLQLLLPRRGTSSPAPRRSPTWPAERGAGFCIPPSTSSPRHPGARRTGAVKGETGGRTRSAAAGEHRTGEDFRAKPGPCRERWRVTRRRFRALHAFKTVLGKGSAPQINGFQPPKADLSAD